VTAPNLSVRSDSVNCFVVDASVAVKWVPTEIHSGIGTSLYLERNYTLLVPDFLAVEVTNVLEAGASGKRMTQIMKVAL